MLTASVLRRRPTVRAGTALGLVAVAALASVPGVGAAGAAGAAPPRCFDERATVVGTSGDDVLRGTPGEDVFVALAGDDTIIGLGAYDLVCGGRGADTIDAGDGRDFVVAGRGADRVETGSGSDIVFARAGDSTQTGPGSDVVLMSGGEEPAYTELGRGDDALIADSGRSEAQGGPGTDTIVLPFEIDPERNSPRGVGVIDLDRRATYTSQLTQVEVGLSQFEDGVGGTGRDTLTGNGAANQLDGGPGPDTVSGLGGDDRLAGGAGRDSLDGGEGADRCVDRDETTVRVDCERPAGPATDRTTSLGGDRWTALLAARGLGSR